MKNYLKHPFVKFLMVLVSIIIVALTVWVVVEVISEIRDEIRGDEYSENKTYSMVSADILSQENGIITSQIPATIQRYITSDVVKVESTQLPDGSTGYELYYQDGRDRYFRPDGTEIFD